MGSFTMYYIILKSKVTEGIKFTKNLKTRHLITNKFQNHLTK